VSDADFARAAELVRNEIRSDVRRGSSSLVDFANANASTPRLKHEALVIGFHQRDTMEQEERLALEERMLDLLRRIEEDHRVTQVDPMDAAFEQVRARYRAPAPEIHPVCVGERLGKKFSGSDFHLYGVDLTLTPGEITAVVGQNANGKTTLLRIVAGELRHSEGMLTYPLLSQGSKLDWSAIKSQIAYLPQELAPWQGSLRDNLHYEAALHGIYGDDNEREVDFFIERFELGPHLNKRWAQLSGGTKLRFALARVLIWKPKLLVLDEPLANLDVLAQSRLLQDVLDLARSPRYPLAVMMSSQHLHELEAVASSVVFLRGGDVVFNGKVEDIGKDRPYNVYELGTDADPDVLRDLFHDPDHGPPLHDGVSYVLKTATAVDSRAVMQKLLTAGIDVTYFRNISHSIKSLFE
jgi:ABC-2 type transport system ATP-binding protein